MTGLKLSGFLVGGLLAGVLACGPALAQQSTGGAVGTTSGPAAGSPTHPESGSASQPVLANKGGHGQPGRPAATGTEAGKAPQVAGVTQGTTNKTP
jgi:hypothetical protein